jgi:iron complex transport system substrate-binding protein
MIAMTNVRAQPSSAPTSWRGKQIAGAFLSLLLSASMTQAREITDQAGRQVAVPDRITHIYAAQPYTHVLTYMLAPDMLIGHLSIIGDKDRRFLRPEAANLPLLGGAPGSGQQVNMETVLAAKPDIVLMKGNAKSDPGRATEKFAQIGLPVVFVDLENIDDYPAGIEFFGKLIGRVEKARELADRARKVLADVDRAVATIAQDKRLRVYYAESADGLATECDQSFHADAIKRAGGTIVHHCLLKTHMGMEKVSLEQIIAYNPEVIVANDAQFEAMAYADPRWAGIKAVAEHKVWTVPRSPFNWIDRPPSVMRILGVQWLAHLFYPKAYAVDMRAEVRDFHQRWLGVEPTAADLDKWLH